MANSEQHDKKGSAFLTTGALAALDSAIRSHRAGELDEWELQLVRRRMVEEVIPAPVSATQGNEREEARQLLRLAFDRMDLFDPETAIVGRIRAFFSKYPNEAAPSHERALAEDVLRCIPADWKPNMARDYGNLGPILAEYIDDLRNGTAPANVDPRMVIYEDDRPYTGAVKERHAQRTGAPSSTRALNTGTPRTDALAKKWADVPEGSTTDALNDYLDLCGTLERELIEDNEAWDETSAALNEEVTRREKAEAARSAIKERKDG